MENAKNHNFPRQPKSWLTLFSSNSLVFASICPIFEYDGSFVSYFDLGEKNWGPTPQKGCVVSDWLIACKQASSLAAGNKPKY